MLLENLDESLTGRVLDFGCGCGVIGAWMKQQWPELKVELVDASYLALTCARKTLALNNLDADIYPSNGWSDIKGRFNAILTNPPFHDGVKTQYTTTENFMAQSKDHLNKNAPLYLVANSFLKYEAFIQQSLGNCEALIENNRFRLYKARR
jgi:16S rRNA (guanine1207-N2)-methyltransferase